MIIPHHYSLGDHNFRKDLLPLRLYFKFDISHD